MIQFYFLSILFNVVGGYALCADIPLPKKGSFEGVRIFLLDRSVRLALGILMSVTGVFKLLNAIRGDLPVVGDFLPATAGIAGGVALLVELYNRPDANPAGVERKPGRAEMLFMRNRSVIGIAAMITGVVHFAFPMVLFL
jgi:hypothetical protein